MAKIILRRLFSFLIFAALIASVFLYPDWYKKQLNKAKGMYYVAQGDKYLRKQKFQKAIDNYITGLDIYPEHYGAWFNLGNIYVGYEDFYSAIDAYGNAIKYNPNYVLARMNYGIISTEKLGNFDEAIKQYDKIIEIKRKPVYIPFVFNNLKSYKTNIGLAYYNKGVAYRKKATYLDHEWHLQEHYLLEAIKAYQEAVKILDKHYDSRYNLALTYHLNKDYNLAGLTYCQAIELEPMNYEAHYNLAVLLSHLKYYKEALYEMHKASALIGTTAGGSNRQRYIFDVMNDVIRMVIRQDDGMKYLMEKNFENSPDGKVDMTYLQGKIIDSEELDKIIIKNFQTCASKSIFLEEN